MKITIILSVGIMFLLTACSSVNTEEDIQKFRKDVERENLTMSKTDEANIDDDLNPVEQKAVHQIFEKNSKESIRADEEIFR